MNHLGLFEGIGGFSLAARWMGWETKAWCEWNPFGQQVLKYHFPEAVGHGDITKTDFTPYANTIDVLTGGFPCQPFSVAGDQQGTTDDRFLWPEMLRAIKEVRPRWIVGENVSGIIKMALDQVLTDLENAGYTTETYHIPACGIGAPHQRFRIWIVAHCNDRQHKHEEEQVQARGNSVNNLHRDAADTSSKQLQGSQQFGSLRSARSPERESGQFSGSVRSQWEQFPTQPPLCNGNDGISAGLDTTALSFSKWRNESIKAGGNAIVPQVAYEIFKAIQAYEN